MCTIVHGGLMRTTTIYANVSDRNGCLRNIYHQNTTHDDDDDEVLLFHTHTHK